jgi:hypothetical protein
MGSFTSRVSSRLHGGVAARCVGPVLLVIGAGLLAACSQEAMMQKFASPEEQATAKAYIDQLRRHEFGEIERAADASISGPSLDTTLNEMAALIPADPPMSVQLVGAQRFSSGSAGTNVNLTFEYRFPAQYVVANVATKVKDGQRSIVGFHVYPESESLESRNRFTLSGKSALQYGVLAYAIVVALFTVVVLVVCARTKIKRRKWLWILFILFGFGKFSVNWTTGKWGIMILYAQLFSAGAHADFFGPWIISASLPLGAAFFSFYRNKLRGQDAGAVSPSCTR